MMIIRHAHALINVQIIAMQMVHVKRVVQNTRHLTERVARKTVCMDVITTIRAYAQRHAKANAIEMATVMIA